MNHKIYALKHHVVCTLDKMLGCVTMRLFGVGRTPVLGVEGRSTKGGPRVLQHPGPRGNSCMRGPSNGYGITSKPEWAIRPSVSRPARADWLRPARIADQRKSVQGPAHFARVDRGSPNLETAKARRNRSTSFPGTRRTITCTCKDSVARTSTQDTVQAHPSRCWPSVFSTGKAVRNERHRQTDRAPERLASDERSTDDPGGDRGA